MEINGYFDRQEAASKETISQDLREINRADFEKYMEQVKAACDNFDEEGIVAVAEELRCCSLNGVVLADYFTEVKKLAGDFEYEQALITAEKAAEEIMRVS